MATNVYFNNFSYGREQDVLEDLIIESIKIYGHEVRYMPRTVANKDSLFCEDPLSSFQFAIPIEMYVKNIEGFDGEGDFLSKFGIQLRDEITLTVSRKRWNQIRTEKLIDEVGFNYQLESANTDAYGNTESYLLEDANGNNYSITTSRPNEGDLIYFPMSNDIFEIKFVEHESIFYQTGVLHVYDLSCEKFSYSSERLDTGIPEVDIIEDTYNTDLTLHQYLMESGDLLLNENGQTYILEHPIANNDTQALNDFYTTEYQDIVDWSEDDPFSEGLMGSN